MSRYKLRRCAVCKRYHASYLVPDGLGGTEHYCYDCWRARYGGQAPATAPEQAAEQRETQEATAAEARTPEE